MKNLMRGTIYQLKRDNFFFGCPCSQLYFTDDIHPFFFSGTGDNPCDGCEQLDGDIFGR